MDHRRRGIRIQPQAGQAIEHPPQHDLEFTPRELMTETQMRPKGKRKVLGSRPRHVVVMWPFPVQRIPVGVAREHPEARSRR